MLFEDINYEILGLKRDDLYSPEETLTHGNLFKNIYQGYKGYPVYKIVATNEKDACLLKIYQLDQVLNDLNLYLDLNPKDEYMYSVFKNYVKEFEMEKDKYEKLYGPLMLNDTNYECYRWSENPWPWEGTRDMYV